MATTSRSLRIEYAGDINGVKRALGEMDKAHSTFSSKLQSTGKAISGVGDKMSVGLTLPLVAFGKVALEEFGDAQKVAAQTGAVLESTGGAAGVTADHVADLGDRLGNLAAVDNDVVQGMENVLLTFTNIQNSGPDKIFDKTSKAVVNLSSSLHTDMQSAAIQVGKALNDPVKGLTSLTRVGVSFTEQQKKQIAAMVKAGDTAGAQKVILGELQKEFGGSAKAAGESATPMQRLSLTFRNIAESVGQFLVPIIEKLGGWLERAGKWFQGLSPSMQKTIVTVLAVVAAIGPLLAIFGRVISIMGAVGNAFRVLMGVFSANPWILLIAATVALVIVIVKNWDSIKAFLARTWEAIKGAVVRAWQAIYRVFGPVFRAIAAVIKTYVAIYKAIITTAWKVIKTVVSTVLKVIAGVVKTVFAAIVGVARFYWGLIKTVVVNPLLWVKEKVGEVLGWIRDKWHDIWNGLKDVVSGIWDGIKGGFVNGINGLIGIVERGLNALIAAYNKVADLPLNPMPHVNELSLPRLARGTRAFVGGLALVGENGPELAELPAGSRVHPAGRTERMMRGGTTVVYRIEVHVEGSVISQRDLVADIRDELLREKRRSGALGLA